LVEGAIGIEGFCPLYLAELGRTDEALDRATASVAASDAAGLTWYLVEPRTVALALHFARGDHDGLVEVDWLIETTRAAEGVDQKAFTFTTAAAMVVEAAPERARALLAELDEAPGIHETVYFSGQLSTMVRTALAADDPALALHLVERLEPRYPLDEHALCAARAQLAEAAGDHSGAADLYAEAAERWLEFGNVPERAYALLGQGRCLIALGNPDAAHPLHHARELFTSMGYAPALAETEALLLAGEESAGRR
jgi:tetratricopeptide (TPR) repeat protein